MTVLRRMPPPEIPYCILGKKQFCYVRTIKVPEEKASYYQQYDWIVLARDSENPLTLGPGQMYDANVSRFGNDRADE